MQAEKEILNYTVNREATDNFNGVIILCEDSDITETEARFWVEQQRKDVYTEFLTLDEANAAFEAFLNDTMF